MTSIVLHVFDCQFLEALTPVSCRSPLLKYQFTSDEHKYTFKCIPSVVDVV